MDLAHDAEEQAFRLEVRAFIAAALPEDIRTKTAAGLRTSKDDSQRWHKILAEKGWIAPAWPKAAGGCAWEPARTYIFEEEMAMANCPPLSPFPIKMVGPVIYTFGTDAQKAKWLAGTRDGDMVWCQGYSEPGAGSDLANLQTRAVKDGDDYIVNGGKIWTSYGHQADWMFALVRTAWDGKPQEGISVLLIDMHAPGVSHRPIITIDGSHILNEIRFDNVRVPQFNRIGEENKGWTYAKFLLGNERASIAFIPQSTHLVARLKDIAAAEPAGNGGRLADDPDFRSKLASLEIELAALRVTNERVLFEVKAGSAGNGGAILKSKGTFISQALSELQMEAVQHYGMPWVMEAMYPGWNLPSIGPAYAKTATPHYMRQRANTIEGGSEEVQKNVIAKQVLGL
jgi:alkylation response protein AidB-like acyl-CoA dehydrogenase